MALATRQTQTQQGITSFFDAPFTAVNNNLMETIYSDPDVNPATRLLAFIARFSTGYLKPEVVLKEGFVLNATGMSRSSLYKAKRELIDSGKITVTHTQTGNCVYRLAAAYQCLKGHSLQATAIEKAAERWGSPSVDPTRPQPETPYNKEIQENLNQHQSVHATPSQKPNDDAISVSCSQRDCSRQLVDQLKSLGVTEFMAHRLSKAKPSDIIERAIQRVRTLEVINPAGYLVSEILRGGYQDRPDPTRAQRDFHREIHEKRQTERLKLEQHHQESQDRAEQLWQKFLALPLSCQLELKQKIQSEAESEGFSRLRGWGEGHPLWRGLLLEQLQTRLALNGGETGPKAPFHPPPPGPQGSPMLGSSQACCSIGFSPANLQTHPPASGGASP